MKKIIGLSPMVNDIGEADLWVYLAIAAIAVIGMIAIIYAPV